MDLLVGLTAARPRKSNAGVCKAIDYAIGDLAEARFGDTV